jgi:hypothetical protein
MDELTNIDNQTIKSKIYTIRGMQVMLDSDLAELYEVDTKVFNQAIKRNIDRFPEDFRFQLIEEEFENLRSQFVTSSFISKKHGGRRYLPYVFTEQGVSMLSAILKSKIAVDTSLKIMRTFVNLRRNLIQNSTLFDRLEQIEKRQLSYEIKSDDKFEKVFEAIEEKSIKPKQGIFYDGQVYDAYIFVSDLIKSAKSSIILIDNYIDDSVLTLLSKNNKNISINIYTKDISKQIQLDIKKYNQQYQKIEIKKFTNSHDRFIILDKKEVYHIGASLKDLGKKWFAFSKLDMNASEILSKIENKG